MGDDTRLVGPALRPTAPQADETERGESAYYLSCNRNKRSVAIDLAKPAGADSGATNWRPEPTSWWRTSRSAA